MLGIKEAKYISLKKLRELKENGTKKETLYAEEFLLDLDNFLLNNPEYTQEGREIVIEAVYDFLFGNGEDGNKKWKWRKHS